MVGKKQRQEVEQQVRRVSGPRPGRAPMRLSLGDMRKASNKTQVEVAKAMDTDQGEISRLEQRDDVTVSTLRKYASALGAELEIVFVYPLGGQRILLQVPPDGIPTGPVLDIRNAKTPGSK